MTYFSKRKQTSVSTLDTTLELWHALENATTAPDDEAHSTIEDSLNSVQQSVLLVGQTNNTISYHR